MAGDRDAGKDRARVHVPNAVRYATTDVGEGQLAGRRDPTPARRSADWASASAPAYCNAVAGRRSRRPRARRPRARHPRAPRSATAAITTTATPSAARAPGPAGDRPVEPVHRHPQHEALGMGQRGRDSGRRPARMRVARSGRAPSLPNGCPRPSRTRCRRPRPGRGRRRDRVGSRVASWVTPTTSMVSFGARVQTRGERSRRAR